MPELPEVETVARRLKPLLVGRTVTEVEVTWPRIVDRPGVRRFRDALRDKTFRGVGRRGKYLIFELAPHGYLLGHLRMSGDLVVVTQKEPMHRHIHARILLDNDTELRFDDTRKFGRLYFVDDPIEVVYKLGPEPLAMNFGRDDFVAAAKKRSGVIKSLLLNQSFVAGVGNIYAVESLWRAGIHPLAQAKKLRREKLEALYEAVREILAEAIENQGTDIGDGVWKAGDYTTKVYGREGEPCLRCKNTIKRIVVAQRGTEFCPKCQRR